MKKMIATLAVVLFVFGTMISTVQAAPCSGEKKQECKKAEGCKKSEGCKKKEGCTKGEKSGCKKGQSTEGGCKKAK